MHFIQSKMVVKLQSDKDYEKLSLSSDSKTPFQCSDDVADGFILSNIINDKKKLILSFAANVIDNVIDIFLK